MVFSQPEFLIFLIVILLAAWSCRSLTARNAGLLLASYYFYAHWDWRFCGLLLLSTAVDFTAGRAIAATNDLRRRRRWLTLSLLTNLGMLGFFKYFDFFVDSAASALQPLGLHSGSLRVILPVGISFYTFQTMSYTIDVYRRRMPAASSFLSFALYVAFFPQLVAGPIVRARELLPQLSSIPQFSKRRFYGGFALATRGAVKKVLIADRLAEVVDVVFAGPELYCGATIWIAVIAYAGQIYYDFSGYSDIAIGVAKMLGYRFPANFRHPYLSVSVSAFWQRWHMTLSRWLRDYLYIPMGGNRSGTFITFRNLIVTMTLGGLWHGAAWTFVVWGLWHGVALAIERAMAGTISPPRCIRWLWVAAVVLVGWVLFRSPDFATAITVFSRMVGAPSGITWLPPLAILGVALMVIEHLAWTTKLRRAMRLPIDAWYSSVMLTVAWWCLMLYAPRGFRPFVYFQF